MSAKTQEKGAPGDVKLGKHPTLQKNTMMLGLELQRKAVETWILRENSEEAGREDQKQQRSLQGTWRQTPW